MPPIDVLEAKRRWTREDWIAYALRVLEEGGVAALRIDDMARRSGRTRGSFYGYFKNRDELLDAMLVTFERLRVGSTEYAHRRQREAGRFTLSGLVEVQAGLAHGELLFHANLELAVRMWARSDPRPQAVLQRLDHFRLMNACVMVQQEMPAIGDVAEVAVLFNALLQGRGMLQIDDDQQELAQARQRMFRAFVSLCRDASRQRTADAAATVKPASKVRRRGSS